jgi:hypothetical protein
VEFLYILGPILRRSALPKDTKTSPELNGSPESQRVLVNTSPGSRMQPRSRRKPPTGLLILQVSITQI